MKEFFTILIYLVVPSVICSFLLVAFANWASFIFEITPNSAIQLNMRDAIYAFQQGKIKRHPLYWEFYTNQAKPEFKVKTSFFAFAILNILYWIDKRKKRKLKVNKEATNKFLKELYNKGED